jgi:hypothetical protein
MTFSVLMAMKVVLYLEIFPDVFQVPVGFLPRDLLGIDVGVECSALITST